MTPDLTPTDEFQLELASRLVHLERQVNTLAVFALAALATALIAMHSRKAAA